MRDRQPKPPFAKRSLGQNFLVDAGVILRIVEALGPSVKDAALEIGPGRGALTQELIERAGRVYALEFDRDLAAILRERFAGSSNFRLIEDDALGVDFASIEEEGRKLRLVANLPYNISTAILQRLFEARHVFEDCVLMFQREVVERITAPPGTRDRGFLTVLTEAYYDVDRLFDVPPSAFRPIPKVWSSVVRLRPTATRVVDDEGFRELVSRAFAQKRKTLQNNLKGFIPNLSEALSASDIAPDRRAETLSLDEWLRLSSAVR